MSIPRRDTPRVFVDLDGVLANMHKAACPLFNVEYPQMEMLYFEWLFQKAGVSIEEFLGRMDNKHRFWEDIELFPWVPALTQILDTLCPNWYILTAATQDPRSWAGKQAWVKRYFGEKGIYRLTMLHGDKSRVAARNSILVDDHVKWCHSWMEHGGQAAFHWKEFTEDHSEQWTDQLNRFRGFLIEQGCEG